MYIILDHTRSSLMTISDGSLPSNVGGGGNVRNILRRVFSIMKKMAGDKTLPIEQNSFKSLKSIKRTYRVFMENSLNSRSLMISFKFEY